MPAVNRIVLGVQYDGTPWHGWQTQPDGHTVQDRLEAALLKFLQEPVRVVCAGRTDSGVHALEQVVHFDTAIVRTPFSWVRGLNTCLPPSIAIRWAHCLAPALAPETGEVADAADTVAGAGLADGAAATGAVAADPGDPSLVETGETVVAGETGEAGELDEPARGPFHARFSATARRYRYLLYNNPVRSPLLVGKAGWVFRPLDIDAMRAGAAHLLGTHDFTTFRAIECQAKSPVRCLRQLTLERQGDMIVIDLVANAFLHHMVRNIVGALIQVGNGSRQDRWIADILDRRDRSLCAPTFMPDGLYLAKVDYDAAWGLPQQPWPPAGLT